MSDTVISSEHAVPVLGSAVKAGLIAGLVFMAVEMVLVWLAMGMNPFAPPQMIAAIVMGPDVLPDAIPPGSNILVLLVGMLVHFALAVALAFVFKYLATALRLNGTMLIVAGVVFGLIVYLVNFYGMSSFFPWFAMARNWISIAAHAIFGIVLAYALMSRATTTVREQPA